MKGVIIVGSARRDGDTARLVQMLAQLSGWPVIDLNDYNISHYDYGHANREDDYLDLMRALIGEYELFLLATPVYWYAMSGVMKVFFDRLTDLLTIEQDLGRQLRGKAMAAVSVSIGNNLGEDFWLPFSKTAAYLGIQYRGHLHTLADELREEELNRFLNSLGS
jgi:multimeric flavodoxin WrbA